MVAIFIGWSKNQSQLCLSLSLSVGLAKSKCQNNNYPANWVTWLNFAHKINSLLSSKFSSPFSDGVSFSPFLLGIRSFLGSSYHLKISKYLIWKVSEVGCVIFAIINSIFATSTKHKTMKMKRQRQRRRQPRRPRWQRQQQQQMLPKLRWISL